MIAGTRIGGYEILAMLGAGGMGEVYRARDLTLGRDVALKILPPSFTGDPDRVARFRREAQVLASLNHPHIAHIHGFEESSGVHALVLEFVDGLTLADRIAEGAIPIDDAVAIAAQLAEALQAAHEQGIVHRDLKPANIKIRSDGTVKVLDFGLAKLVSAAADLSVDPAAMTMSPTITTPAMTAMGMILGTAAYMSPEQAKGRPADKRSDVWAYGCVLYEMLTARRPFEGEDVSDTLAAVLRGDPDWTAFPNDVPPAIRTLIRRCLVRDPRNRIADLAVARFVLSDAALLAPMPVSVAPGAARSAARRSLLPIAVAVLVTAVAAGAAAWLLWPSPRAQPVTRFVLTLPDNQTLAPSGRHSLAISPDGTQVVFVATNRLYLRTLSELDAHIIPGIDSTMAISSPTFSPDGRWIAFHSQDENLVKRIPVSGGAPLTVCSAVAPSGMRWHATGIVIGQLSRGIVRCAATGGVPEQLVTLQSGETAHGAEMLPDGSALIFAIGKTADGSDRWDKAQIVVQTLKTGARKVVVTGGSDARYVPTGHLLFAVSGMVFAVPFDPVRQTVTGGQVAAIEGVRRPFASNTGAAQFDVSQTGTLVYAPGPAGMQTTDRSLAIADRAGTIKRLPAPPGAYNYVRASPDGKRLAIGSDDGKEAIVSVYELAGTNSIRRLTVGSQNRFPIWSGDSQRLAFQSNREGDFAIFAQRADGTGQPERLTRPAQGERHVPESWSPDGKHLSVSVAKDSGMSLWIWSLEDKTLSRFGHVESREPIGSVFSPDGKWITYSSSPGTGGASEGSNSPNRGVYIQPFPPAGSPYQVPRQQMDFQPVWGPKGDELIFVPTAASGRMAIVPVATQPAVAFGMVSMVPAAVTDGRLSGQTRAYDILPDGTFVGVVGPSQEPVGSNLVSQLRIVVNWLEELKQRTGGRGF